MQKALDNDVAFARMIDEMLAATGGPVTERASARNHSAPEEADQATERSVSAIDFDAGGLIALERGHRRIATLLDPARRDGERSIIPATPIQKMSSSAIRSSAIRPTTSGSGASSTATGTEKAPLDTASVQAAISTNLSISSQCGTQPSLPTPAPPNPTPGGPPKNHRPNHVNLFLKLNLIYFQ